MKTVADQVVFITGGTGGIGKAIAEAFLATGATVCVSARTPPTAESGHTNLSYWALDVTDEQQVMTVYQAIKQKFGRLDTIVLNAGISVEETTLDGLDTDLAKTMIDTNLLGVFLGLKHGANYINDGGSIITMGSAAGGGTTVAMQGLYAATKAGVHYLTRTVAIEQGYRGVRANTVKPASIAATGMMTQDDGGAEAQFFSGITALNRMGKVSEVAQTVLFLASDNASYITGAEIPVDGGLTAGLSQQLVEGLWSE